MIAVYFVML